MLTHIERNEGDVEGEAGILKGLLCEGAYSEDVVGVDEIREAVVGGCWIGQGESGAVEHMWEPLGARQGRS